jgi:hypothetical protein
MTTIIHFNLKNIATYINILFIQVSTNYTRNYYFSSFINIYIQLILIRFSFHH